MTGDSLNSLTDIQGSLKNIIEAEDLTNNPTIQIKAGSEAGDGYASLNSVVEITSQGKSLSLFVKSASKSKKLRKTAAWGKAFIREIYFYDNVYPAFLKFQEERNVMEPFVSVAQCYATSTEDFNEHLIFENLRSRGYTLFDRKTQMNHEHVGLVLETYAKFHAVSYAMKDQDRELYKSLSANLHDILSEWAQEDGMVEVIRLCCEDTKRLFDPVADEYVVSKYETMADSLTDSLVKTEDNLDEYSIITHGDCWCNNLMFLYEDSKQRHPVDVKLLDWQILRENTPVLDLSYFFYTVASKEMMANLDNYLKVYHNNLSERIRLLGSNPEIMYPYAVFREHWRKFSRYGLMMAFMAVKVMLTDKDETPNLVEWAERGEKVCDAFNLKIRNAEAYDERMRALIEHFVLNKFI